MKLYLVLFSLILASCASVKPLSHEEKLLSAQPVSISSEDFTFTELILILKINHESKTYSKCEGIFPDNSLREELIKLYYSKKLNNGLKIERKHMVSFMDKTQEIVIYGLYNDASLAAGVKGCERLTRLYELDGFSQE